MTPRSEEPNLPVDQATLDLFAYVDGELDDDKVTEVETRLRADPVYAARMREILALGEFVRSDADRIYANAGVDAIADQVMARISAAGRAATSPESSGSIAFLSPHPENDQGGPARPDRERVPKGVVLWVAFGTLAAAAAALLFFLRSADLPNGNQVRTPPSATETLAHVKTAVPPPNKVSPAVDESASVEVEDLEVGEGATVIYTRTPGGSNAVVWVNDPSGTEPQGTEP